MNALTQIWSGLARLARAVSALADTVEAVNDVVRERTLLADPPPRRELPPPRDPEHPEDVDHTRNGYLPPTDPPPAADPKPEPRRRNGRPKPEQTAQP